MVKAFAPGRVNLIGEHTDYNDGLCLPFAIEAGVTVSAERIDEARVEVRGERFELGGQGTVDSGQSSGWPAFVRGVLAELQADGHELRGARLEFDEGLPQGAGLSSSAALAVGLALALLAVAGEQEPDRVALAKVCSRVENNWLGARTGLLDQMAVLFGEQGRALRLDCRALETRAVPLDLGEWTLATLDSGSEHDHGSGGYNRRRAECERARLQLALDSLRDATLADAAELGEPLGRRVRHVVTENKRVEDAVEALSRGDLEAIAALLDASHRSLRDDYDVSTPAIERAIDRCREAGAAGARIVGGGFGGAVLGLFPPHSRPPEGATPVAAGPAARLL